MPLPALQGTRQPLFCFFVLATEMATNVFSSLFARRLLALGVQGACLVMAQQALAQQASAISAGEQAQRAAQKAAQKTAPKTAGAAADAPREAPSLPAVQVSASAELEPGAAARVQGRALEQAGSMADVMRYQPLVEAPSLVSGTARSGMDNTRYNRGGSSGYNVRGVEGNRVAIDLDGVELPDAVDRIAWSGRAASTGTFSMGRDFIDPEVYGGVDIQLGTTGSRRSAGGIGGAVSFRPKSARDYLREGKNSYLGLKAGYASANRMWTEAVTAAGRSGAFDGLLSYVRRDGREAKNSSPLGMRSEPEDIASNALLLKGDWRASAGHTLSLTADLLRRRHRSQYESSWLASNLRGTESSFSWQNAKTARDTLQFTHLWTPASGWFDQLETRVYGQYALMDDTTDTLTNTSRTAFTERARNRNRTYGLASTLEKSWGSHRLRAGVSASRNANEHPLESTESYHNSPTDLQRPFPDNTTTRLGVFAEDAITLRAGSQRLVLTPGLRIERVQSRLRHLANMVSPSMTLAQLQRLYGSSTASTTLISPSLSLSWYLQPQFAAYVQWRRSGRAPTSSERYGLWRSGIYRCNCIVVGDAGLKAETSNTFDIGVKGSPAPGVRLNGSVFYTQYKNFIGVTRYPRNRYPGMFANAPAHLVTIFKAGNRDKARIYGLELGTRLEHGTWTPALKGLYSSLAFGYSKGESRSSYEGDKYVPLDTVQPAKLIAGIGYDAPGKTWGVNLLGTFARGKQAQSTNRDSYRNTGSGLTESTVEFIRVPGFGRLDLWAYWQITPALRLDAGVQNLANKSHWLYSNARSYDASSAADWRRFQLAAQPGRSFNISLTATF